MGYYLRAFCTVGKPPTLRTVLDALASEGGSLLPEADCAGPDVLDNTDWERFEFLYKPGKNGILVECNRQDGTENCLVAAEVAEFLAEIGPPGSSRAKRRVTEHLKATRFIIACQLPSSDIDDDGFVATNEFLTWFEDMCDGMVQADGEGFYVDDKLLLAEE